MFERLFEIYQRKRIVNINTNIVAAGLLAIVIAKWPVTVVGNWIGADEHPFLVTLAAGGIDLVVDVASYFVLHWLANHWKPLRKGARPRGSTRSFLKDALLIQFERTMLSPVYYTTAMGLMYTLQEAVEVSHGWAFVIGFTTGIMVTRVVHTIWGLKTGRFADNVWHERAEEAATTPLVHGGETVGLRSERRAG